MSTENSLVLITMTDDKMKVLSEVMRDNVVGQNLTVWWSLVDFHSELNSRLSVESHDVYDCKNLNSELICEYLI